MFNLYNIKKKEIDNLLVNYFEISKFNEILNYSISNGKRIRPIILLETFRMITNENNSEIAIKLAIALEMIHNYSLIHDDLPSMDNDNYRRGIKTVHYKYGENFAILAGDALLNYAFELLFSVLTENNNKNIVKACKYLSQASGYKGMILGQFNDIEDNINNINDLIEMYKNKTCRLLMSATVLAGYASNVSDSEIKSLEELGFCIGMAFQLQDDLLDLDEDTNINKVTYLTFNSIEQTKKDIKNYTKKAMNILNHYENNDFLKKLLKHMIDRKK